MDKLVKNIVILFGGTLAFGEINPFFKLEGLNLSTLTAGMLLITLLDRRILNYFYRNIRNTFPLLIVLIIFLLSSIIYGYSPYDISYFNFKFFFAIICFNLLVSIFNVYPDLITKSLLSFSLTAIIIVLAIFLGVLDDGVVISKGRVMLYGENPNSTSTRFTIAFVYVFYYILENFRLIKGVYFKYLLICSLVPLFLIILFSGSRGALLSLLISVVAIIYFSNLKKSLKVSIFGFFILIGVYLIFHISSDYSIVERMNSSINDGETAGRDRIWKGALDIYFNYPVIGVGEGGYYKEIYDRIGEYKDTHNIFLYLLCCGGSLSFIFFVGFLGKIFINALQSFKQRVPLQLVLFFLNFLIIIRTGSVLTYLIMWYLLAIISVNKNSIKN